MQVFKQLGMLAVGMIFACAGCSESRPKRTVATRNMPTPSSFSGQIEIPESDDFDAQKLDFVNGKASSKEGDARVLLSQTADLDRDGVKEVVVAVETFSPVTEKPFYSSAVFILHAAPSQKWAFVAMTEWSLKSCGFVRMVNTAHGLTTGLLQCENSLNADAYRTFTYQLRGSNLELVSTSDLQPFASAPPSLR
jgi:hypothetical protein